MTPEDLKKKWAHLRNFQSAPVNADLLNDIIYNRLTTTIDRLTARYRRITILGFVMALMMVLMYFSGSGHSVFSGYIPLEFAGYFLLCSLIDGYLWCNANRLDLNTMPIEEIATCTRRLRLVHLLSMVIIIPFAVVILIQLFGTANFYTRLGMIAGGTVGLAVGLNLLFQTLRDYRTLTHH